MRHALVVPLVCVLASSCASPADRNARDFVQWDARSDAANIADDRCGGHAELIAGRAGLASDDYRCVAQDARLERVPATYACKMEDGSSIVVSVLTDMSGEVRDGGNIFQLKSPIFQSNDTLVLVRASPPTWPYQYSLFLSEMRLIRSHVAVNPAPDLQGSCRRT